MLAADDFLPEGIAPETAGREFADMPTVGGQLYSAAGAGKYHHPRKQKTPPVDGAFVSCGRRSRPSR